MCGITGKIFFDRTKVVSSRELELMTNAIVHRGPDDFGYLQRGNVAMGFRRLSIIDLETGHQPMSDSTESIWITFNGEIYNYKSIRRDLEAKGYIFSSNSDTESIIYLYQEYGEKCLEHLQGMFAFTIWDEREQLLFGARDRFGIKPFYYFIDQEKFIWASEMKSILTDNGLNKDISLESLDYYFAYGYTPRSQSIFSGIQKLEPGHFFVMRPNENKKFEIKKYWSVEFNPDYSKSESYWKEVLYESLNDAVKMRMVSDVPLGAFLSGGVDSSIVVSLMALNSIKPIKTFSIGFEEKKYNELKYARLIADKYKTDHHEFIVKPESLTLLPDLVKAYDEPFADSSAIPTYYVSKYTKEHVTVALSGDGGDELFAGYKSYDKMINLYDRKHNFNKLFHGINRVLPDIAYGKGLSYYLSKDKNNIGIYFCLWKDYERRKIFKSHIKEELKINNAENIKKSIIDSKNIDFLSKMQYLDMETYLVDDILTKVDRASMMNSLEARVPILDHKFAELSFKIPSNLKRNGNVKKYILKETFKHILPPEIISHKKQGFAVPLDKWFKGELKEYSYDTLSSKGSMFDYVDQKNVLRILNNHQKGVRDYSSKIWSLLFLNEWFNQNY